MSNDNPHSGSGALPGLGAPNLVGGGGATPPFANGSGVPVPPNPRDIKARIFSAQNKQRKYKRVMFFGVELEIKQSSLKQVVDMATRRDGDEDDQGVAIYVLLNYAFIPGTEERIFGEEDTESLLDMPFGEDFNRVIDAWREITGIKIGEASKN